MMGASKAKKGAAVNREEWLERAAARLNEMLAETTDLKPAKRLLVSAGWPRRDRGGQVIGQCFPKNSGGGVQHVFVSPALGTATEVLPVLLHELIHAADDCKSGHKGDFRKAWKALGFIDKPTCSVAGKELKAALKVIAGELGPYPHKKLFAGDGPAKQTTRMLKVACPDCGCVIRMTRKWIEDAGEPTCACGTRMEEV